MNKVVMILLVTALATGFARASVVDGIVNDPVAAKAQALQLSKEDGRLTHTDYNGLLVLWVGLLIPITFGYYHHQFGASTKPQFPGSKKAK